MDKLSAKKFRELCNEFDEIDEDTLSRIVDFLDDSESSEEPDIMYKGHNLTYIMNKISDESNSRLYVSEKILKYYIDVTMPKNACLVKYARSDYDIADIFTINTDGWAINDHHPIGEYQELINTQNEEILLKLLEKTSSTWPLLYYAKPIKSDLYNKIVNLLPKLWYINHYDLIEQNPELTKLLMDRKRMYSDNKEWIFAKVRNKTPEMCLEMIKHNSYCNCIVHIPSTLITEEILCIFALNALWITIESIFSIKSDNLDKITQKVANCIARNSIRYCGTWEHEFDRRIELIPERFRNIQVYTNLLESTKKMGGSQTDIMKKIPEQYWNILTKT